MSFIFTITLSQDDKFNQDELEKWHPIHTQVKLCLYKPLFSKRSNNIIGVEAQRWGSWGSAGYETYNADPNSPYWDMQN